MDFRVRRALFPAVPAAVLTLVVGWHAATAWAVSVDPELVAESVAEDGYYVDSGASYLKSDSDLDKLRSSLERAGHAGVVVLPAGVSTTPVITRLLQEPNRRATYVVLTGSRLQVASNSLPKAKVDAMLARAKSAGTPKSDVLTFLALLNGRHPAVSGVKHNTATRSAPVPSASESSDADDSSAPPVASPAKKDTGSNIVIYGAAGVAVLALAVVAIVLLRRGKGRSGPGPTVPPAY